MSMPPTTRCTANRRPRLRHYCYLPLYVFCGAHVLCARLRPANIDAAAGVVDELAWIVDRVRQAWPTVAITVRGDSGSAGTRC